ncbi:MAG TPA: S53 family peptidase [Streptosporangiaceae bacterium]|jgi:subtilase family serine protease|nr:S53 family peptidase [Streptosporangiaceae bacterium]
MGTTSPSAPISFDIVLRPTAPAGLQALATAVSTPGSPSYHKFLTAAQFAARFGQPPAVIQSIDSALRDIGLAAGPVSANHMVIPVTATVGRASTALRTHFESYRLSSGQVAFANTLPPQLPAAAARVTQAIAGLNTLLPAAPARPVPTPPHPRATPAHPRATPAWLGTSGPQPCQAAIAARDEHGAWTYDQLAKAYSVSGLYSKGDKGRGTTVALPEFEPFTASDISAFQACYGTKTSVSTVRVDGGATGRQEGEAALDIETVIAMAPAARVVVHEAPVFNYAKSVIDVYTKIIDAGVAGVLSISWAACEPMANAVAPGLIASENTLFQQAATEGMSVFAGSGDSGSEACYLHRPSMKQLAVEDPASQPYVTSVGGTELASLGPPPAETVWNESAGHKGAGGGGISSMWTMPAWQKGPGVISGYSSGQPCGASKGYCREVPDVSASADLYRGYVAFYGGHWLTGGGTSAAAPLWAAMLADIESQASPAIREGFLNPRLYSMPAGRFNDIVSGNNDYLQPARGRYPATRGYDMASGLGTPIAPKLALALGT